MAKRRLRRSAIGAVWIVSMVTGGCSAPGGPASGTRWNTGSGSGQEATDAGVDTLAVTKPNGICTTPHASEMLPPRVDLMGMAPPPMTGAPRQQVIQTSEVYLRFHTICGQCHADGQANGGRTTTAATFATDVDSVWLASITLDDPNKAMPPEMKAYKDRPADDPVKVLAAYLQAWIAAGRPRDSFAIDEQSVTTPTGTFDYTFTSDMAAGMSNLGTCIPDKVSYGNSSSTEMESKDAMFAAAAGFDQLPKTLSGTDLVTFDSSVLAANGVIAYVPTYPLWSDGSAKVRYIRVPKGTSVKFDKETQTFDIPPNTRFYKTFLRKVKDIAGRDTYRKIETRLIVARPDQIGADGVTVEATALFGTYIWNDGETEALLHNLPNRDGKGFSDFGDKNTYVTDELLYSTVVDSVTPGSSSGFDARLDKVLLDDYAGNQDHPGLREHYAIPGSIRCNQCHMGSPSKNFVLGFFPLQVARQPDGQAGTYEPTGADELTQLQRLIDYGLITGMESPADVIGLEQSQAPRHARTVQELAAQAYMVGNCAHCHNPRGFPSISKPELAPVLNFMPGRGQDGGGIFEFPLTKMSPIRTRGADGDIPIPYITPSLRDYPVTDADMYRMDSSSVLIGPGGDGQKTWSPKYLPAAEGSGFTTVGTDGSGKPQRMKAEAPGCTLPDSDGGGDARVFCGDRVTGHTFVAAPWRSLIYRNVDTPFPYFDDYVPFPHMPMNTAGYDYRAPRLMGDWMVSLPAVRADQSQELGHGEDDLPSHQAMAHDGSYDDSPQPYVEVKPGDPRYGEGLAGARARLEEYHQGIRYNYREEALGDDILDEIRDSLGNLPDPEAIRPDPNLYLYQEGIPPHVGGKEVFPAIGVPYHSHWFDYDPTDDSDNWAPRRGTAWMGVLVDGVSDTSLSDDLRLANALTAADPRWTAEMSERAATTAALAKAELTDSIKNFATTPVPFGLWKVKPECQAKLASMPKVSAFSQAPNPPWWMTKDATKPAPDSPVYMMSPGQALYRHICFNCHGPKADGKGLQGDALAAASDGRARPANFVAGLFGPVDHPGDNLRRVFGGTDQQTRDVAEVTTAAEGLGSRYMAWMALGGTLQHIPLDIVHQVEVTRILGVPRPHPQNLGDNAQVSANMLNLAKGLCSVVLPAGSVSGPLNHASTQSATRFGIMGQQPEEGYPLFASRSYAPFVQSTGDWEMWVHLCSDYNPPVVRVYSVYKKDDVYTVGLGTVLPGDMPSPRYPGLIYADSYPAMDVWDQDQQVQHSGVDPKKNLYPACFMRPSADDTDGAAKMPFADSFLSHSSMPTCPDEFLVKGKRLTEEDTKLWVLNGAITAGMSVFSYLRDPNTDLGHKAPPPYYDECQLLP